MQTAAQRHGCENRERPRGKGGGQTLKLALGKQGTGHGGAEMASSAAAAALEQSWRRVGGLPREPGPYAPSAATPTRSKSNPAGRAPSGNGVGEHV